MPKCAVTTLTVCLAVLAAGASAQTKPAAVVPHSSAATKEAGSPPLTLSGGETVQTGVTVFTYGGQGPLGAGTGERYDHKHVTFTKKYSSPPKVLLSISGFDGNGETSGNLRFETYLGGVDQNGFDINVNTWGDSKVYLVNVSWLVIGK